MPWHIETSNPECSGFAVVKDVTLEVEGCHRTRAQAERQMAALYASEPEARASYTPTGAMRDEARRGLAWREEFGRGGTEIGVARARDISNGRELSLDTVTRMVSYFARHEVDKEGQGFYEGDPGYPSAGRIAWALWGGDPGMEWADEILDSFEGEDDEDEDEEDVEEDRAADSFPRRREIEEMLADLRARRYS